MFDKRLSEDKGQEQFPELARFPAAPALSHAHFVGHAFATRPAPPHPDSLLGSLAASSHDSAGSPHAAEAAQVRGSGHRHGGDSEILERPEGFRGA